MNCALTVWNAAVHEIKFDIYSHLSVSGEDCLILLTVLPGDYFMIKNI